MDLRHEVWLGQAEDVAVVAQRPGMVAKTRAAELFIAEALVLQHHAHGPIKDHDPLAEQLIETLSGRGCRCHGDP